MRVPRFGSTLLLAAASLAAALVARVQAADYSDRIGITLGGGAYELKGGAKDHASVGPWAQAGLRWGWLRNFDIEGTYRYGFNWDDTKVWRATTTGVDMGVLWNQRPDARWTPQVFLGTGAFWFNVESFTDRPSPGIFDSGTDAMGYKDDGKAAALNGQSFKAYGGLGAEYFITPRLSLRALMRIDFLFDQHIDNTGASDSIVATLDSATAVTQLAKAKGNVDANNWIPAVAVNLTWFFGARDGDRDGISDGVDACPADPEDRDGFQDEDGCPDLDNDGDGVADVQDKCPDQAEDVDGFGDEDGCPDPDNDGDGVADVQDKCPDQAEDADKFQDEDGCPDLDNDGDSVPDSLDQCADTPAGRRVDENGCPVTEREQQLFDTGMIRLSNVRFESGKADITPETAALLDEVGAILSKFPTLEVEIGGHTDSRGSDALNKNLSEQRAQSVLGYLREKFPALDASKYRVAGYGESMPIADNSTPEGQAQNRRVEFKALNLDAVRQEMEKRQQ
jgi:outer membrane protein OmpA-like peptidoglycan-associated protein